MVSVRLDILGCGAVTPVGLSAASTCAAVCGQVSGYSESALFHQSFNESLGPDLDPIVQAQVPIPHDEDGNHFRRLVSMAAAAAAEALTQADIDPADVPLILGVREPFRQHPGIPENAEAWIDAIETHLAAGFHAGSCVIPEGHVSALKGLQQAQALLRDGEVSHCLIGGVDSFLNTSDLERLVGAYRVLGPGISRGLVPGEGAVFLAVGQGRTVRDAPLVSILGIGMDREPEGTALLSEGHPTGRGLERALQAAIQDAGVEESQIDMRLSDINGEIYRADDSILAATRFYKTYRRHLEIWHPADCLGDMGAAMGPMLIVLARDALARGLLPVHAVMCEGSSDDGQRAGCVIARTTAR